MSAKRCCFCDGPIEGPSRKVWSQLITSGEQDAPVQLKVAHPSCAAMLDDDEDSEETTSGPDEVGECCVCGEPILEGARFDVGSATYHESCWEMA